MYDVFCDYDNNLQWSSVLTWFLGVWVVTGNHLNSYSQAFSSSQPARVSLAVSSCFTCTTHPPLAGVRMAHHLRIEILTVSEGETFFFDHCFTFSTLFTHYLKIGSTAHVLLVLHQCFLFQDYIKYFLDTLIQKLCFSIMKLNNFRGELTDNSAKKEALFSTSVNFRLLSLGFSIVVWRLQEQERYERFLCRIGSERLVRIVLCLSAACLLTTRDGI